MFSRKVLAIFIWFSFLFYALLHTASIERFYTAGLDQKPLISFQAKKIKRVAYNLSNFFDMQAESVRTDQKKEVSLNVQGHLDHLDFSADKMTLEPRNGLFLEGNVRIRDSKEKKTIRSQKAFIDYKKGCVELIEDATILQEEGPHTLIKAKKVFYQKDGSSFLATIEGPIECIVEDLKMKDYDPFKR